MRPALNVFARYEKLWSLLSVDDKKGLCRVNNLCPECGHPILTHGYQGAKWGEAATFCTTECRQRALDAIAKEDPVLQDGRRQVPEPADKQSDSTGSSPVPSIISTSTISRLEHICQMLNLIVCAVDAERRFLGIHPDASVDNRQQIVEAYHSIVGGLCNVRNVVDNWGK